MLGENQVATYQWARRSVQVPLLNVSATFGVRGALRVDVLQRALLALLAAHESLCLRVTLRDGAVIADTWPLPDRAPLTYVEAADLACGDADAIVERYRIREAGAGVDPTFAPPSRFVLIGLAADRHVLIVTVSHLVADGASLGVLVEDLMLLYEACARGATPKLDPPPTPFSQYVKHMRGGIATARDEARVEWWRTHVAPLIALEAHRDEGSTDALTVERDFDPSTGSAVREAARSLGTSFYVVAAAAFAVVVHGLDGRDRTLLNTPSLGGRRGSFRRTVGDLTGNQALIVDHTDADRSVATFVREVHERAIDAADNGLDRSGLVRAGVVETFGRWTFQTAPRRLCGHASCTGVSVLFRGFTCVDLWPPIQVSALLVEPDEEGFFGQLQYRSAAMSPRNAAALLARLEEVLAAFAADTSAPLRRIITSQQGE